MDTNNNNTNAVKVEGRRARAISRRLEMVWGLGHTARNAAFECDSKDLDFMATWNWLGAMETTKEVCA